MNQLRQLFTDRIGNVNCASAYQRPCHRKDVVQLLSVSKGNLTADPPATEKLVTELFHIHSLRCQSRNPSAKPWSFLSWTDLSFSPGWKSYCGHSFLGTKPKTSWNNIDWGKDTKRPATPTKTENLKAGMFWSRQTCKMQFTIIHIHWRTTIWTLLLMAHRIPLYPGVNTYCKEHRAVYSAPCIRVKQNIYSQKWYCYLFSYKMRLALN